MPDFLAPAVLAAALFAPECALGAQLVPAPAPAPAPSSLLATAAPAGERPQVNSIASVIAQGAAPTSSPAPAPAPGPASLPGAAPPAGQRALVDVTVNSVDQGIHTVLVSGTDVGISRDDLSDLGLTKVAQLFASGVGQYVFLSSLSAGLSFTFDQSRLVLAIVVKPEYLAAQNVSLSRGVTPALSRISSAFLNYGLLMTQGGSGDLSTQLGSTLGPGVFSATFNDIDQMYRMTSIFWRDDDPISMRSFIVGDAYTDLGDLSGNPVMRGVTYERNFTLNPYFSRLASHSLSGYVTTPSTALVYVNGQLIDQVQLAPGAFNITNLPQLAGITNAQVVIRDAFGNTQVLSQTYYEGVQALPAGVDNYTYSIGDPQDGEGHSIGPAAGVAEYTRGLTNSLTFGGRAEYSSDVLNGGPVLALATRFGEIDLLEMGSSGQGYAGSASEAVYNYLGHSFDFNILYQTQTPNYANVTLRPTEDRLTQNLVASLGLEIFHNQYVNVHWDESQDRDFGRNAGYGAQTTVNLTRDLSLSLDFEHEQGGDGIQNDFYTSLLFPIGQNTFVSVTQDGSTQGGNTSYEVDRPAQSDHPLGFTFSDTTGSNQNQIFDQATYEAPFGNYYVQHSSTQGYSNNEIDASGAIDFARGSVLFSRPITSGYAVVDTGIPGVPVYVNGLWVGTTNAAGLLANPDVVAYGQNEITLDTSRLPLNLSFDTTSQPFSSPYLSAGLARFRPVRTQSFLGTIVVVAGGTQVVPQYGSVTLSLAAGGIETSELGDGGEFYFSNLTPGTYPAHVAYAGGDCEFSMTIPQTTEFYVRMGQLTCTTSKAPSSLPPSQSH